MELDKLKGLLKSKIHIVASNSSEIDVYLFGSILNEKDIFKDIDILIIYDDPSQPPLIRKILSEIELPIHLLFLTREEENEFNFIHETEAKKVSI